MKRAYLLWRTHCPQDKVVGLAEEEAAVVVVPVVSK